ncbi:hypothetical protein [Sulfurimonas sp.]
MKYSYIKPRKKSPFTTEVQLLITFFSMTVMMLVVSYTFLLYKDYRYIKDMKEIAQEQIRLQDNIEKMKNKIAYIEQQKALSQKVYTQNSVLKDSISNLFDLVPQRITLSRAELLRSGLILYGVTPSKDVYNFMLQAPLRSIFQETYTSFYPAQNGWLNFVSTNYMKESDNEELNIEN